MSAQIWMTKKLRVLTSSRLLVREFSQISSNWRSSETAQLYLNRQKIPVIWDIDTRALVRHIRNVGALRGMVSTDGTPADQLIFEARTASIHGGPGIGKPCKVAVRPTTGVKGSIELASSPMV